MSDRVKLEDILKERKEATIDLRTKKPVKESTDSVDAKGRRRLRFGSTATEIRTSVDGTAGHDLIMERKLRKSSEDTPPRRTSMDELRERVSNLDNPVMVEKAIAVKRASLAALVLEQEKEKLNLEAEAIKKAAEEEKLVGEAARPMRKKPSIMDATANQPIHDEVFETARPESHSRTNSSEATLTEAEQAKKNSLELAAKSQQRKPSSSSRTGDDRKGSRRLSEIPASERLRKLSQAAERDRKYDEAEETDKKRKESLKADHDKAERRRSADADAVKERRLSLDQHWDGDRRDPNAKRVSFDGGAARRLSYDVAQRDKERRLSLIAQGKDPDIQTEDEKRLAAAAGSRGRAGSSLFAKMNNFPRTSVVQAEQTRKASAGGVGKEVGQDKRNSLQNKTPKFQGSLERQLLMAAGLPTDHIVDGFEDLDDILLEAGRARDPKGAPIVEKKAWWLADDTVLLNHKYEPIPNAREQLAKMDIICLYFATFTSRQTRLLTKYIQRYYFKMKKENWPIEFIYVSMDDMELDCRAFVKEMGECWLTVPWHDQVRRRNARNQCNISRHPRLIVIKNVGEGIVLTSDGKDDIEERGEGAWFYWLELEKQLEMERARRRREAEIEKRREEEMETTQEEWEDEEESEANEAEEEETAESQEEEGEG